jgi:hypothetical protein
MASWETVLSIQKLESNNDDIHIMLNTIDSPLKVDNGSDVLNIYQ